MQKTFQPCRHSDEASGGVAAQTPRQNPEGDSLSAPVLGQHSRPDSLLRGSRFSPEYDAAPSDALSVRQADRRRNVRVEQENIVE